MTLKKFRKKEFKRYLSLKYPRPIAQYLARHDGEGLSKFGYQIVDDLTLDRVTYVNHEREEIVYIGIDGIWKSVKITKPLYFYYD